MRAWLRRRALRRKVLELAAEYQFFCVMESDGPSASVRALAGTDASHIMDKMAEYLRLGDRL